MVLLYKNINKNQRWGYVYMYICRQYEKLVIVVVLGRVFEKLAILSGKEINFYYVVFNSICSFIILY